MVMAVSFMIMIALLSLSLPLLSVGTIEPTIAGNILRQNQARFVAETGGERALAQLISNPALIGSAPATPTTLYSSQAMPDGSGTYTATYQKQGWSAAMIQSTGTGTAAASAQSVVRMIVSTGYLNSRAILTQNDLAMSVNAKVQGALGSVHSNGNLTLAGSVSIAVDATAKGNYVAAGSVSVGGQYGGGKPAMPIPSVNPASLITYADYMLEVSGGKGRIREVATGKTHASGWNGWTYSKVTTTWSNALSTIPPGTYYADNASVAITGTLGTALSPWRGTLIATKDIVLTGNIVMAPDANTITDLADVAVLAGGDVVITPLLSSTLTGLIAAHEQAKLAGTVSITGAVVAEGAASLSLTVLANSVGGSVSITNTSQLRIPLQGPVQVLSWTTVPG